MNELMAHRAALLGQPGMSDATPARFPQQEREENQWIKSGSRLDLEGMSLGASPRRRGRQIGLADLT